MYAWCKWLLFHPSRISKWVFYHRSQVVNLAFISAFLWLRQERVFRRGFCGVSVANTSVAQWIWLWHFAKCYIASWSKPHRYTFIPEPPTGCGCNQYYCFAASLLSVTRWIWIRRAMYKPEHDWTVTQQHFICNEMGLQPVFPHALSVARCLEQAYQKAYIACGVQSQ